MPQRLFSVPKIGLFLDAFTPGIEKRRGESTKIITCTFRVQPFDVTLAKAIDDGIGEDSGVRAGLFKLSTAEPKPHVKSLGFRLDCPRQQLLVHAAPDTAEPRIALDQVKVFGTYARDQKDVSGFAFILKGSFGPVGRDELEFLLNWYRSQQFVTFHEAEPGLFEDEDDDIPDDADETPSNHKPMFEDDDPNSMPVAGAEAARTVPRRGRKPRKKVDHDGERAEQQAEGKAQAH